MFGQEGQLTIRARRERRGVGRRPPGDCLPVNIEQSGDLPGREQPLGNPHDHGVPPIAAGPWPRGLPAHLTGHPPVRVPVRSGSSTTGGSGARKVLWTDREPGPGRPITIADTFPALAQSRG
jgi:hypothetical protein